MALSRAEFLRLTKRPFTRYMTAVAVLALVAAVVGTYLTNHRHDAARLAQAEQMAEAEYQDTLERMSAFKQECLAAQELGTASSLGYSGDCEAISLPTRDEFDSEWYLPPTFTFSEEFTETTILFAAVMALLALLVGASYVGAEWSSGGMMNLLLWCPNRLRVLFTKLAVLLSWLTSVFLVLAALWTAALWWVATTRGSTDLMTAGAWQSVGLAGLRALALTLAAGTVGFALATIGRRTVSALGIVIAVVIIGQAGLAIALELLQVRFAARWQILSYVFAWLRKETTLVDYRSCDYSASSGCSPRTLVIGWEQSGVLMAGIAALLLTVAAWQMRRRDIH